MNQRTKNVSNTDSSSPPLVGPEILFVISKKSKKRIKECRIGSRAGCPTTHLENELGPCVDDLLVDSRSG